MLFVSHLFYYIFFFQAEDGIRDTSVTGVQTCALPILIGCAESTSTATMITHPITICCRKDEMPSRLRPLRSTPMMRARSEERRVGKECRCRGWREHDKKKCDRREKIQST